MTLEHPEIDGMTTTYCLAVQFMKETQVNSAAFVLSWYRQNVDPRANHARLEIGPEGTPTGRTIISHEGGLPDQVMHLDFIRACLAFKDWFRNSRKKWATTSKDKVTGMYEAIQSEESAARGENRKPSMNKVLSIYRAQRPSLSYDKVLLRFDEVFGAYLKAIGRRTDWEW